MRFATHRRSRFEAFAQTHTTGLIDLAFMVCGDRGRAEDAAQEALVQVYQRWSRLENPLAYARRTAVNATRDDWRREQRTTRALDDASRLAGPPLVADLESSVAQREVLIVAMASLPHRQRAVIALRYLNDLTELETAAVLGVSVGTVKRQAHDALARLRQTIESELTTDVPVKEKC